VVDRDYLMRNEKEDILFRIYGTVREDLEEKS
jgi:hypothetical protein